MCNSSSKYMLLYCCFLLPPPPRDTSQEVVPQRLSQRQTLISFNPLRIRSGVLWKKDAHQFPTDFLSPFHPWLSPLLLLLLLCRSSSTLCIVIAHYHHYCHRESISRSFPFIVHSVPEEFPNSHMSQRTLFFLPSKWTLYFLLVTPMPMLSLLKNFKEKL